jgi:Tfp pilus assembly protein FimV
VHGPIGQQQEDGRTHIAAPAPAVAVSTPAPGPAGPEAEAGTAGAEAGAEATARAEAERVAAPGVMSQVLTHLIAHLPVGVVVLMRAVREAESVWAGLWVE